MERTLIRSIHTTFAADVLNGLSAKQKFLPSKYLYDERGGRLFQAIMRLPEYYLTDCEYEIISTWKEELLKTFTEPKGDFILVELGAGDGVKTKVLLKELINQQIKFFYIPIDISAHVLEHLKNDLSLNIPGITVQGMQSEFLSALEKIKFNHKRKVIMFLGSSIGNFENQEAILFLSQIAKSLEPNDLFLIGFDLIKDPTVILNAYNDKQGITRAFNFNLLERINKELEGNFDISKFKFYPVYDPLSCEVRSYLVSKQKQEIYIETIDKHIILDQWEPIHTEISKKYDISSVEKLAENSGFKIKYNFYDCRNYFLNSIWCLK